MYKHRNFVKRCFLLLLSIIMIMNSTGMSAFAIEPETKVLSEQSVSEQKIVSSLEAVTRVTGENRYETSLLVADTYKEILGKDKLDEVIIATGNNFADALSAPYLAYVRKAPILFTDGTNNNVHTLHTYIKTNIKEGGKVYIIGGEGAVSSAVEEIEGYDVVRLKGSTRYETNLEILEEAGINSKTLIIASGREYKSCLSALALGEPVLLVNTNLSEQQKTVIENMGVEAVYIVGDSASVSGEVEESLRECGLSVYRVAGDDDIATSVAVAETMFANPTAAVITHADIFTYGLCGAPLAAELKVPLLITNESDTDAAVNYTKSYGISAGYVIGAEYKISDDTIVDIFSLKNADEILLKGIRLEDDITPPEAPSYYEYVTTSSSVTLWWGGSSSEDFVKYEIFNPDTNEILMEITDTDVTISGLEPNKTYHIGVRAVDAAGNKSLAVIYTFTTDKGKMYKISWDTNGDGNIDDTTEYAYGEIPVHDEGYKPADAQYTYTFTGWSPSITTVSGNITYTAQFERKEISNEQESSKLGEIIRITGKDQYATSQMIADTYKNIFGVDKFDTVIIVSGSHFSDAISGSYLAYTKKAPILLTDNSGASSNVVNYIKSNVKKGGTIYLLGGEGVISYDVENSFPEYIVKRISGSTRYETNLEILEETGMTGNDIIVATGRGYNEYLSALALKRPILLVNSELTNEQIEFLENEEIENIYIVGDFSSISEETEEILKNYGTITRFNKESSSLNSVQINQHFFESTSAAVITHADSFTYGLCGAPLAAELNIPLLITEESDSAVAVEYAQNTGISAGYVIAAEDKISDETVVDIYTLNSADEIIAAGDQTEAKEFYTIGWDIDGDGTVDETREYQHGVTPVYDAGYKKGDEQYSYIFTGWTPTVTPVISDRIHVAQFKKIINKYTISWDIDGDGNIDETTEHEYGTTPSHDDVSKEADAQYTYTFTGWSPSITSVTGDKTYTAQFAETTNKYTISWDIDGDGNIDETTEHEYGTTPSHDDVSKEADAQYTYTFTGWIPSITSVTGDKTYTAQFAETTNKYTISWDINGDGKIDETTEYEYGTMPAHNDVSKEADAQYTYTFTGWSPSIAAVSGDKTYTAQFAETTNKYTISWDINGDGKIDETTEYEYGTMPAHNDVSKEADAQYTYTFTGWSPSITAVTGDITYTAQYEQNEIPTDPINPPVDNEDMVVRLFGSGRYETGYAVADALKDALGLEKFEAVVIATGKNFADALAGSYLAVEKNAPILLTNGKDDNVAQLHAYIKANVAEGGKVYILGGEAAVPAAVETIKGYDVVRLYGDSRYDTNLAILNEAGVSGDSIIIATGKTFADSLSASAAKLPILLVKPNGSLNGEQKGILKDMNNIYIIGGDGAVSAAYEAELEALGTVTRVFGKSRYDTSVEAAKTFCNDVDTAVIASGKNFPDGLCGGPLAAALNAPLVLTKDGGTDAAAAYVAAEAITGGYVLGGNGALTDASVVEVFRLENADNIINN